MSQDVRETPLVRSLLEDEESAALLRRLGLVGMIIVPLIARGTVIGALAVATDDRRPPLTVDDLTLVTDLAGRAALAYDNAVLYTQQRDAAEILQRGLLPALPSVPGVEIYADYLPATARVAVGGDWYDVFALADGRIGITVGDVMGHDLNAAALMGQFRSALLAYAYSGTGASDVLDQLDRLVAGQNTGQLATCVYGVLDLSDPASPTFEFANAGHPPPLLIGRDGVVRPLTGGLERMLGITRLLPHPAERVGDRLPVEPGDVLVLYTDGLLDAFGPDIEESLSELCALVSSVPRESGCGGLVKTLVDRVHQSGRTDDVAVLALAVRPGQ
jgi:serine phosphatase RsbU (regulator of sigma subunit)